MWERSLMRAARWAHNPPSAKRVKFFLAILAFCILVYLIEKFVGWPDFLTLDPAPRHMPKLK